MKTITVAIAVLFASCALYAQHSSGRVERLKRSDRNGDGKIDDGERTAIRELIRKRWQQPQSTTLLPPANVAAERLIGPATKPGPQWPDSKSDIIAFAGVNVLPMTSETVLSNQTVIVDRGTIKSIEPAGQSPVPAGAVVVDGRGKYLMPGLADMHFHLSAAEELNLCLANGVTTAFHHHYFTLPCCRGLDDVFGNSRYGRRSQAPRENGEHARAGESHTPHHHGRRQEHISCNMWKALWSRVGSHPPDTSSSNWEFRQAASGFTMRCSAFEFSGTVRGESAAEFS